MVLSLSTLILAVAQTPAAQAVPAEAQRSVVAMTKDGIRLEVSAAPAVGDAEVMTAYGRYFTPLDPVAVVLALPKRDLWRNELKADPTMSMLPVISSTNGDGRIYDLIEMADTLEHLWRTTKDDKLKLQRSKEINAVSNALWKWGQRLDPVPKGLDQDERVEWLWKRLRKTEGPEALLSGGRLLEEVVQARGGVGRRQVSITELSRAIGEKNPYIAHSAARIAAFQHVMDVALGSYILSNSIAHEHPAAREGCAIGIAQLYPNHARLYWADTLFGAEDDYRIIAAWHLVNHLPKQADGPLVAALAATTTTASRQITVGGLTLRVEDRRRKPTMPLRPNSQIQVGSVAVSGGDP